MAEHIDVDLSAETDADRRLKEWEERAEECPCRNEERPDFPQCYATGNDYCAHNTCPFAHWGWR